MLRETLATLARPDSFSLMDAMEHAYGDRCLRLRPLLVAYEQLAFRDTRYSALECFTPMVMLVRHVRYLE